MEAPKGGHLVRTGTRPAFGCSTGKFFGCPKNFDFSQSLPRICMVGSRLRPTIAAPMVKDTRDEKERALTLGASESVWPLGMFRRVPVCLHA
jgi:hypothetical protein